MRKFSKRTQAVYRNCYGMPAPAFYAALSSVTESYADRFGFYVYDSDHAELLPMDTWLRTADLSKPYFVGSVIDYHS